MPHYEFLCCDCQKFFDKILSLVDCEEGAIICPALQQQERRATLVRRLRHRAE